MVHLLRRVVLWRVAMRWYLVVLLILPAIWFGSVFFSPGGIAAFRVPSFSLLVAWLSGFAFAFFAATCVEELGWRGFALPRLQGRYGPLLGTLLLGSLWALWHLPVWAFFPSLTGAGTSFLSFTFAITYLGFVGYSVAFAVLITWVFNHSRSSILLAVLFHASATTAPSVRRRCLRLSRIKCKSKAKFAPPSDGLHQERREDACTCEALPYGCTSHLKQRDAPCKRWLVRIRFLS
jgi:uncharacterized protein